MFIATVVISTTMVVPVVFSVVVTAMLFVVAPPSALVVVHHRGPASVALLMMLLVVSSGRARLHRRGRRGNRPAPSLPTVVTALGRRPAFIDRFDQSRLVKEDDPRLAVLGVASVFEVAKVDVGYALVRVLNDADADVSILFVLPVERVPDDVVARLGVKRTDAEDFIAAVSWSHPAATSAAAALAFWTHGHYNADFAETSPANL